MTFLYGPTTIMHSASTPDHSAAREKAAELAERLGAMQRKQRAQAQALKPQLVQQSRTLIVCVECEERSAVIKDCVWGDHFCQKCFNATHATGRRRGHLREDIDQAVCAVCDRAPATSRCVQDGLFYCEQCWVSSKAARPEVHNHTRRYLESPWTRR